MPVEAALKLLPSFADVRMDSSFMPDPGHGSRLTRPHGARALCDFPEARLEFDRQAFAADPRIAAFEWER